MRGGFSEAEGSAPRRLRRPGLGEAAGRPAGPPELLGGPTHSLEVARLLSWKSKGDGGRKAHWKAREGGL